MNDRGRLLTGNRRDRLRHEWASERYKPQFGVEFEKELSFAPEPKRFTQWFRVRVSAELYPALKAAISNY